MYNDNIDHYINLISLFNNKRLHSCLEVTGSQSRMESLLMVPCSSKELNTVELQRLILFCKNLCSFSIDMNAHVFYM